MSSRRQLLKDVVMTGAALGPAFGYQSGGASKSDRKVHIAIVGGGFGSTFYWHEHPQCVVSAVTDLYPDRRGKLRDAYRCDNVYNSLEDMLSKRKDLDAVAIFSDAPSHVKHVTMCMERGLHVISAVPACQTLEDAEKLRAVVEKTGLKYMMAESSYYRQPSMFARDLFNKGGFGELFYTEVEYYHDFDFEERLSNKKSLYYNPDGSNSWRQGMPPMHYPTHALGFVVCITKERIASVSCLGYGDRAKIARLKSNPTKNPFFNEFALMHTNRNHMVRHNECRQLPATEMERAQWYGEKGSLLMAKAGIHPEIWQPRYGKPEAAKIPDYWNSDLLPQAMRHQSGHGGSAVFISAEFINAILENRQPTVNVYEALAVTVPGLVAHQSALKQGEQMKVPGFDRA